MTTALRPARPTVGGTDYATVLAQVQDAGLLRRRHGFYFAKIAFLLVAMAGVWLSFVIVGNSWIQLAVAAGLGALTVHSVLLAHDAAHKQVFASARANDVLALAVGTAVSGISLAWWKNKHAKHHAAPNHIAKDPDIEPSIVHFYPAESAIRSRLALAMHARQGWWFYPLLVIEALNLQVQSFVYLVKNPTMKRRWTELFFIVLRLGGLPAVLFLLLPAGKAAAFLGLQLVVMGVYLGMIFAVSHIGMAVIPREEKVSFFQRQVLTSRNVAGGHAATFAMGGLNYQIEHHLFPSMPRPNLRHARPIVQNFCRTQGIAYHEVPIHVGWAIVIRYLNAVGIAGRNAYSCPTAAVLR